MAGTKATALTKVLHVINGEHYSGAERVQDLLAQHLPAFGYEVGFACVKPDRFPQARHCHDARLHLTFRCVAGWIFSAYRASWT